MAALNHFSRTGSAGNARKATPKPARASTLGRLTSAKVTEIRTTDRKGVSGVV